MGLKGGPNIANNFTENMGITIETSSRIVPLIGACINVGIYEPLFIQLEPRYIEKGSKANLEFSFELFGSIESVSVQPEFKLGYAEIPFHIMAKFKSGNFSPYFFAGASLGFLLSAKYVTKEHMVSIEPILDSTGAVVDTMVSISDTTSEGDIKDSCRSTEFSFETGFGLEYKINPKFYITVDARYSVGLSNIFREEKLEERTPQEEFTSPALKSRDFRILLGFLFSP